MVIRHAFKSTLLIVLTILTGCSWFSSSTTVPEVEPKVWIQKGTGAFLDRDQQAIYAVGHVTHISIKPLAREIADTRARTALAAIIQSAVQRSVQDYMNGKMSNGGNVTSEQMTEIAAKVSTNLTLSGAMIVDRHEENENEIYSLARLPLSIYNEMLKQAVEASNLPAEDIQERAHARLSQLPSLDVAGNSNKDTQPQVRATNE